jgi:S-adenosyl-L-methionine hydrolase (adenosine-forming)
MAVITLTTDFGLASPYVAAMKGVILSINPAVTLLDLSHTIPPQDLRHAAYFLATAVPYFPPRTIHVCVVDPGVGSARAALCIEANGQRLVGPDNGVFTLLVGKSATPPVARRLADSRYWKASVSSTFHGRDIFSPVAAHLSLGVDPAAFGPVLPDPVLLAPRSAVTFEDGWRGEVQFVDDFGNLITNIPACKLKVLPMEVSVAGLPPTVMRWVRTYAEAAAGELVCLFSSDGFVEIAEVNGNAARRLGVSVGAAVRTSSSARRRSDGST